MADAEWSEAVRKAEAGDVLAMRHVCDLLARRRGLQLVTRTTMPAEVSAYFDWSTNTATCPLIVDFETFAVTLHEEGHGIAGKCPQREPHRPDPTVRAWWHCVACETAAWRAALDAVPFTLPMFRRLQSSLRTYRRTTPASVSALAELDTLTSFTKTFAEPLQARVTADWRREWLASVRRDIDDQPNSLTTCRALLARAMK